MCPGGVFVVLGVVAHATMQESDKAISECAARSAVKVPDSSVLVVERASAGALVEGADSPSGRPRRRAAGYARDGPGRRVFGRMRSSGVTYRRDSCKTWQCLSVGVITEFTEHPRAEDDTESWQEEVDAGVRVCFCQRRHVGAIVEVECECPWPVSDTTRRRVLFAEAIPEFGDDIGYCQTGGFCVDFDSPCCPEADLGGANSSLANWGLVLSLFAPL